MEDFSYLRSQYEQDSASLALWTTGGWKYWKLWFKGKLKE